MNRDIFGTEFVRGMRFVLQKHEREIAARCARQSGATPMREDAYAEAQNNLDAALIQLGDHLYDAIIREDADDGETQIPERC